MAKHSTVKPAASAVNGLTDTNDVQVNPLIKTESETDGASEAALEPYSGAGAVSSSSGGTEDQYQDCRVYVSNIPFNFRSRDLIGMFSPFGKVSSAEIVMNERGSKGFGFVTLDSKQSSEAARSALNGTVVNGRVIEVKKATAMPPRRNFTINRPQPPPAPGPSVLIPPGRTDLFSSRQLPQVQPRSFVYSSPAEQLNSLLVAQNQLAIINPIPHNEMPYSTLFVPQQFSPYLHQHAVAANGIPVSPMGFSPFPLQFLYTTPSTPIGTPASNQSLNAALVPFSTPGFTYAPTPNVNQAGVFIQPPVPCNLAQDLSNNAKGYLDLLGSFGVGNGVAPSSENVSNLAQCTPTQTLRSLDQSCVIDTSLHGEPLKEGQFGPIGRAVPPGNVSLSSSTNDFPTQSSVTRDAHPFGCPSGNESLYTIPVYHHFEPTTDRNARKRLSTLDGHHLNNKLAKPG
ncbi:unnamed protein product [Angiostrongylus costaricensis]|uniref:RRM domain-containing protein n=1 Tax=Angiostrongylus costaricensis TaxID=334426 RepID=A0A0R3PNE4_ANGCS|nr:unnamed protein product [Angiostrongylus costaricensis]